MNGYTKHILVFFLSLLLFMPAPSFCEEPVPPAEYTLTLEQAVATALEHNLRVMNASLETEKSEEKVATFVTLLLVPVLYAIFVLDLKLVQWETAQTPGV